ncbi:MAG: hypothetical protein RSD23_08835, partial [Ruthenibacterium sp.]
MTQSASCDLLLQGGHVIDPANGISAIMDVAVTQGKITAVGQSLLLSAARTVNVKGCYVTPGLI